MVHHIADRTFLIAAPVGILLLVLLAACGGSGDDGLTRAEVEDIVRAEMASAPQAPVTTSGMTLADVEKAVSKAVAEISRPEPALTRAEVEEIVVSAIVSVPPESAPADYTRFFVERAISRYEVSGLEATIAYYNRPESIKGQWYVFIIDENDMVIAHPDPERLGLDLKGWVGTDANGYEFGPEMLSATESGKWVSYVYRNPESGGIGSDFGALELKNVWVEQHDGLLFASGWYIGADEFTEALVSIAVGEFRDGGLPATMAYFASPGSALAGLEKAVEYYNTAETVDGKWLAFIIDANGKVVAHSDPSKIGQDSDGLFGGESFSAAEGGVWTTTESLHVYVAEYDGFMFGSGWSRDE